MLAAITGDSGYMFMSLGSINLIKSFINNALIKYFFMSIFVISAIK